MMTNQEAIKVLRGKVSPYITGEWKEAICMAISALEERDVPDINVGTSKYTVSATAVEEMLKDLLPERGMWEIEGDEAKNAICETVHDALEGLWKLPSAQPEIVRCKDCKFWRTHTYVNGKPKFLPRCGFNQIYVNGEDFCSRAERR